MCSMERAHEKENVGRIFQPQGGVPHFHEKNYFQENEGVFNILENERK